MYVGVNAGRGQGSMPGVFLNQSPTVPGDTDVGRLAGHEFQGPPVSAPPGLELQLHSAVPGFLHGSQGSKLGSHACPAGTLLAELCPQPPDMTFFISLTKERKRKKDTYRGCRKAPPWKR